MDDFYVGKSYRENFLRKTGNKGLFVILWAFDFAGRYIRRFLSDHLFSANKQTFNVLKHDKMIVISNYCLKIIE